MRRNLVLAVAVCLLAVGMRVKTLLQIPEAAWFGTENERVAAALAQGHGFSEVFGPGTPPTAHVAPLYPLLLSGVYRLWGTYETLPGRMAQQILSIGIATLVLLMLPAVARKLGLSFEAGWVAAFIAACLPAHLWDEVTGHHDQVAGSLALLALLWVFADLRQSGWMGGRRLVRAGILLGGTALLCPNLLLVPVLFFSAEWMRGAEERKRIFRCVMILSTISLVLVSPWMVRNYLVLGGFVPLRSNFGLELAAGNRPGANGHTYGPGLGEMHPFLSAAERERLMQMGERAYMKDKERQARAWIMAHPGQFGWLTLRRSCLYWFSPDERWYQLDGKLRLSVRMYGLMGFAALWELARLLWRRQPSGPAAGLYRVGCEYSLPSHARRESLSSPARGSICPVELQSGGGGHSVAPR